MRLYLGTPNRKQRRALASKKRYLAYGGARGGGKSWFVQRGAIRYCLAYPGIKVLITRRTYPELMNNHITPLRSLLHGIAKYNQTEKTFTFPNGSTIFFRYCDSAADVDRFQGLETDIWYADEAGLFETEWLLKIDACVRGANRFPKQTVYTLNPGGPSHGYFKRKFVQRQFDEGENPDDYEFIQALVQDNFALAEKQPEYIKSLEKLPPKIRKAWLEGDWDIYEGQYFEDFVPNPPVRKAVELGTTVEQLREERRWCHVIKPFDPPAGWKIYRSYDWGYGHPFSCGWWAVDYEGRLYRIAELYGCNGVPNEGVKWSIDKQMRTIKHWEQTHPFLKGRQIRGVADPAIWDGSKGTSAAEVGAQYGIYFDKGVNDRVAGWMQVHYRFAFDDNGYPMMYIFDTCPDFIRTIPTLMYDDHMVEDLDSDGEDHIADETRYMCMARPIKPILIESAPVSQFDPLNQLRKSERRNNTTYRFGGY